MEKKVKKINKSKPGGKRSLAYGFVSLEALVLVVLTIALTVKSIVASSDDSSDTRYYSERENTMTADASASLQEQENGTDADDNAITEYEVDDEIISIGDILVPLGDASAEAAEDQAAAEPEPDPAYLALKAAVEDKILTMSIEEKVAQLFLVSPETLTLTANVSIAGSVTRTSINDYPVGGIVYSYCNYEDDAQAAALLEGVDAMSVERVGLHMWLMATDGTDVFESTGDDRDMLINIMSGVTTQGLMDTDSLVRICRLPSCEDDLDVSADCIIIEAQDEEGITGAAEPCYTDEAAVDYVRCDACFDNVIISGLIDAEELPEGMTASDAVLEALNAGVDMVYVRDDFRSIYPVVLEAVLDGSLSLDRLDDAVSHILMCKLAGSVNVSAQ